MSNIYDIFNSRKEGLHALQEGAEFGLEEVVLEGFECPIQSMDEIMEESTMDFIELQGAMFINDLLVENAMYDVFEEDSIVELMESSLKERLNGLSESIKKQWAKLVAWFKQTITNIQNFFTSGEELIKKYGEGEIKRKLSSCETLASVYEYLNPKTGIDRCTSMVLKVKAMGEGEITDVAEAKSKILGAVGATDMSGVAKTAKSAFLNAEKKVERKISSLDANVVIAYVKDKKSIIDSLNKTKADFDKEFNNILSLLKKEAGNAQGEYKENANDRVAVFNFAINVKTKILNAMLACVKKGASDNRAIIVKAIGASGNSEDKMDPEKAKSLKAELSKNQTDRRGGNSFSKDLALAKQAYAKKQKVKEEFVFEEITFED